MMVVQNCCRSLEEAIASFSGDSWPTILVSRWWRFHRVKYWTEGTADLCMEDRTEGYASGDATGRAVGRCWRLQHSGVVKFPSISLFIFENSKFFVFNSWINTVIPFLEFELMFGMFVMRFVLCLGLYKGFKKGLDEIFCDLLSCVVSLSCWVWI